VTHLAVVALLVVALLVVAVGRALNLPFLDDDLFALAFDVLAVVVTVMVVVADQARAVDGMGDAFGNTGKTTAEGMVLAVVAVVAHITLVPWGFDDRTGSSLGDANLFSGELGGGASEVGRFAAVGLLGDAEAVLGGANWAGGLAETTLGGV
jgi:hypothetical protein